MQDFRRERHSVSRLTVHLVCATKYRRAVFDEAALGWLRDHFAKVCETPRSRLRDFALRDGLLRNGCELLACDGEADHLHAIVEYPPSRSDPSRKGGIGEGRSRGLSVCGLVDALKGTSSRLLRKERPDIADRYSDGVLWSPSYFAASTGGAPIEVVRRYVEQQRASTKP